MNTIEFNEQIDRLKSVYGAKNFPNERIKSIWFAFKSFDVRDVEEGITKIIEENYLPPTMSKMKEAIRRKREVDMLDELRPSCHECSGTGRMMRFKQGEDVPYAFKCNCPNGQDYYTFPEFKGGNEWMTPKEHYDSSRN